MLEVAAILSVAMEENHRLTLSLFDVVECYVHCFTVC